MSTNLNYKQVQNVERRTWDVEAYEQRAKDRAEDSKSKKSKSSKTSKSTLAAAGEKRSLVEMEDDTNKEEFIPAATGAAGPHKSKRAFLKARTRKVDSLDSKIGTVEMINPEAVATTKANISEEGSAKEGITKTGVGWHCRVCDCFLKDSLTYLDHINGKKHQRNLGYSMRVERSTKDQVSSRLAMLAKEKESSKLMNSVVEEEEDFYDIVKVKDEEAKRRKEERARKRKERKLKKKQEKQHEPVTKEKDEDGEQEEEGGGEGGIDPNLAAMMGFSGFGGGNKNA